MPREAAIRQVKWGLLHVLDDLRHELVVLFFRVLHIEDAVFFVLEP